MKTKKTATTKTTKAKAAKKSEAPTKAQLVKAMAKETPTPQMTKIMAKKAAAAKKAAMPAKGKLGPLSDDHKAKIGEKLKGRTPWNKGKKTGVVPWTAGVKTGVVPWNKGMKMDKATKPTKVVKSTTKTKGKPGPKKGSKRAKKTS